MSHVQQPTSTAQPTAPASQASPSKRFRLLLVQDDPRARITVWDKFKNAGFDVELATTSHLAADKLRTAVPDAIFIDLSPANAKGVDLVKEARRNKKFADRPIYVSTTAALVSATKRGKGGTTKVFDKAAVSV